MWELTVETAGPFRLRVSGTAYNGFSPPFRGADRTLDSDFLRTYPDRGFTAPLAPGVDHADIGSAAIAASGVGDFVWNDIDRDGVQEAGEPGVAAVTVELWDDTRTELLDVDVTDARGLYSVLSPGGGFSYRLRVQAPPGASFSPKGLRNTATDSAITPTGPDAGWSDIFFLAPSTINAIDLGRRAVRPAVATRARSRAPEEPCQPPARERPLLRGAAVAGLDDRQQREPAHGAERHLDQRVAAAVVLRRRRASRGSTAACPGTGAPRPARAAHAAPRRCGRRRRGRSRPGTAGR